MTKWYSVDTPAETARLLRVWSDAPIHYEDDEETPNTEFVAMLLDIARVRVMTYAPSEDIPVSTDPPARLVLAQLMDARNIWNAGSTTPGGDVGPEGFSFVPRPMDKTIRGIIRPTTGAANVF